MEARCQHCKSDSNLYKSNSYTLKDGALVNSYICRDCNTERSRKYRHTEAGRKAVAKAVRAYEAKNPKRVKAWLAVQTIKAEPCIMCNKTPTDRHHPDIERPKYIVFLCRAHHKQAHRQKALNTV